jgi:hypothetical protein
MDHPTHYSAGESARRAVLIARGLSAIAAGRSTAPVDRALDRLAERAIKREATEANAKATRTS